MNRTFAMLAGVAVLGGSMFLGNQLQAQPPAGAPPVPPRTAAPVSPPAAQPVTRVALVNLGQVLKNYNKYRGMQDELNQKYSGFQKEFETYNAQIAQKKTEGTNPSTPTARREVLETEIRDLQRRQQDMGEKAKKDLGKTTFDRMVQTYREVQKAAEVYARARNIELVLQYTDGVGEEAWLPQVFQRKIENAACWPLYVAPGMDITEDVTRMLNSTANGAPPR